MSEEKSLKLEVALLRSEVAGLQARVAELERVRGGNGRRATGKGARYERAHLTQVILKMISRSKMGPSKIPMKMPIAKDGQSKLHETGGSSEHNSVPEL